MQIAKKKSDRATDRYRWLQMVTDGYARLETRWNVFKKSTWLLTASREKWFKSGYPVIALCATHRSTHSTGSTVWTVIGADNLIGASLPKISARPPISLSYC